MLRKSVKCWNCPIKTGGWLSTLSQNKLKIGDTKLWRKFKNIWIRYLWFQLVTEYKYIALIKFRCITEKQIGKCRH